MAGRLLRDSGEPEAVAVHVICRVIVRQGWFQPPTQSCGASSQAPIMARLKTHTLLSLISRIIRPKVGAPRTPGMDPTGRAPPLEHQKASKIVQIPDDILFIIADHLSLTDRAHLLQTCRYFHSLLEVTQYRHIVVNPWVYYRSDRLNRTLSERPDLVRCIVSYRGPLTPTRLPRPIKKRNRIQLWQRKNTPPPHLWDDNSVIEAELNQRTIYIFTNAVNLRELEITDYCDWMSNPTWEPVITSVSRMPLTRLALPAISETAEIVPLLRALPGLESLELGFAQVRLEDLKESDIPKLKWLKATLQDAATIIPGRPVEEFYHVLGMGELGLDEQLVRKLSLSSSPITKFSTRLYNPWAYDLVRSALQAFARYLPEVQHLTINVGGDIPGQILLDEIPSFQDLRSVKFLSANLFVASDPVQGSSQVSIDSDNNRSDGVAPQASALEDWDVLLQRLRERCPSLVDTERTPRPFCCCGYIET
ncbi:hypothetical protein FRC04_002014 [Tulasnella sp. 424]|nr:hypothetical protein FRC04_002014 [Tulasnella sp. 424]